METQLECGHAPSAHGPHTTGYGVDPETGHRYCYACCAENDRVQMQTEGRITLYLVPQDGKWVVSNWPGSLAIPTFRVKTGKHNIAGTRTDVWFVFDHAVWHGVNIGDNDLLHCRRTKGAWA